VNVEKTQEFNQSDFKNVTIFTDGGSRGNPGPAAGACVVKDAAGKVRLMCGKYLGEATNNIAEYQGVVLAFEEILKLPKIKFSEANLNFNLDSTLVVNQLNGKFKVKNENIRQYVVKVREFEGKFSSVRYKYIPREKNTLADGVVNKTLDDHQNTL